MASSSLVTNKKRLKTAKEAAEALLAWGNEDDISDNESSDSEWESDTENNDISDISDSENSPPTKTKILHDKTNKRVKKSVQNNGEQWNDVTLSKNDTPGLSFEFQPLKNPGVTANLNDNSTPFECLSEYLTDQILDELIQLINDFAKYKIVINNPHKRRSVYGNWKPLEKYEFL
jgi:hypothetical protein